jgi:uncharacterized protein YhdP
MSFLAKRAGVAGIQGVTLRDVSGRIEDMGDHGHLQVDGSASGPVQSFLRFVATSPVKEWTANVTETSHAPGNGELKLKLDLPLNHAAGSKVNGEFRFPGNDVTLFPELPTLYGATGAVAFDEHGFRLDNVRGRFVGGETPRRRHAAGRHHTRDSQRHGHGPGPARGARHGNVSPRQPHRRTTAYSAVVGVRDKHLQVQVASNLNGLALDLPAPLARPPRRTCRCASTCDRRPRPAARAWTKSPCNSAMRPARYVLRRGGDALEVVAGGIGLGQSAPQPASGVTVAMTTDRLNVDAWRALLSGPDNKGGDKPAGDIGRSSPFLPDRMTVRAKVLDAFGRSLDDVSLDAAERGDGGWNMQINSRQIAGTGQWRRNASNPSGMLTVRLRIWTSPTPPTTAT